MKIKEKVLLIEDERTIRGFMQAILTANGYDVLMAGTGAMANTMISSHCPDLIILDLGLPDMDGMTILRSVREWSKVPILVVSARSHERDKVEALDAGADDYLTKPFGTEELLARIRAAIPTIKKVLEKGGSVILMSHLGRPKKNPDPKYSLEQIVPAVEKNLGTKVEFAGDCIGEKAAEMAKNLKPGQVMLLENLRFYADVFRLPE